MEDLFKWISDNAEWLIPAIAGIFGYSGYKIGKNRIDN